MRMIIAVMVVMVSVIKAIIQMNLVITMLTVKMAANKTQTLMLMSTATVIVTITTTNSLQW